jgi:hypothetical protein
MGPTLILTVVLPSLSFAGYEELEALTRFSERAVRSYADRFATEEAKYEGIVALGRRLKSIEDVAKVDLPKLTYQNKGHWRAVLEVTPRDSSVLVAHAHLHVARGETAWAEAYFLVGSLLGGKNHRPEFDEYKRLRSALGQRTGKEINKGIGLHDRGKTRHSLCNNLPTMPVHDLAVHPRDNEVDIGTHGRSVFVLDATKVQEYAKHPARL